MRTTTKVNDNGYYTNASNKYMPVKDLPTTAHSLNATADVNPFRSAIAATFRGYCCEQFAFDSCSRRNSGCTYDHSAAGQEICINSFVLLSKRELTAHSQLPQAPQRLCHNSQGSLYPIAIFSIQQSSFYTTYNVWSVCSAIYSL